MTNEEMVRVFKIQGEILHVRYMVDFLTKGVQVTPIKKGVLGTYKCKQDIIERDERLLENLELIQKYLHELCDDCESFIIEEDKRRTAQ